MDDADNFLKQVRGAVAAWAQLTKKQRREMMVTVKQLERGVFLGLVADLGVLLLNFLHEREIAVSKLSVDTQAANRATETQPQLTQLRTVCREWREAEQWQRNLIVDMAETLLPDVARSVLRLGLAAVCKLEMDESDDGNNNPPNVGRTKPFERTE